MGKPKRPWSKGSYEHPLLMNKRLNPCTTHVTRPKKKLGQIQKRRHGEDRELGIVKYPTAKLRKKPDGMTLIGTRKSATLCSFISPALAGKGWVGGGGKRFWIHISSARTKNLVPGKGQTVRKGNPGCRKEMHPLRAEITTLLNCR